MRSSHIWFLKFSAYGLVKVLTLNVNFSLTPSCSNLVTFKISIYQSSCTIKKGMGSFSLSVKLSAILCIIISVDHSNFFLKDFDGRFNFEYINHGPGSLRFFWINNIHEEDISILANAAHNLDSVKENFISLLRLKSSKELLKNI